MRDISYITKTKRFRIDAKMRAKSTIYVYGIYWNVKKFRDAGKKIYTVKICVEKEGIFLILLLLTLLFCSPLLVYIFKVCWRQFFSKSCVVRFCDKMLLIRVLPGYGEDACTKSKTDGDKATYVENCTFSMIKYNKCFRLRLKSGRASHDHPTTRWWNSIRIYVRRISDINHAWQFEIHSQRRMHKTPSWRANLHF